MKFEFYVVCVSICIFCLVRLKQLTRGLAFHGYPPEELRYWEAQGKKEEVASQFKFLCALLYSVLELST